MDTSLSRLVAIPLNRHPVVDLIPGAWARRSDLRLVDALYVELAVRLHVPLVTTDHRFARACSFAESIAASGE